MTSTYNEQAAAGERIPCGIPPTYAISRATLNAVQQMLDTNVSDTVAIFKALADPIRVRVLKGLRIADLCVCVLVELLDCEYSKLSYHLKLLKEAGLIECTKEGNFLIYHLTALGEAVLKQIEEFPVR